MSLDFPLFQKLSSQIKTCISSKADGVKPKALDFPFQDGLCCCPSNHISLYEDDCIRVLDVRIAANEQEKPHRHEHYSVMFVDHPAKVDYFTLNDNGEYIKQAEIRDPTSRVIVIPYEGMHYLESVDDIEYKAFRVEVVADICSLGNYEEISEAILSMVDNADLKKNLIDIRAKSHTDVLSATPSLLSGFKGKKETEDNTLSVDIHTEKKQKNKVTY